MLSLSLGAPAAYEEGKKMTETAYRIPPLLHRVVVDTTHWVLALIVCYRYKKKSLKAGLTRLHTDI